MPYPKIDYPTFAEILACKVALDGAYAAKYGAPLFDGPGASEIAGALSSARLKGSVPPADQQVAVDAFMALFASFGGDGSAIGREHNGYSSVKYQILYGIDAMKPTPRQKFELDPAKVLTDLQAGTDAVGTPVTQDTLIAGAKFYGKVYGLPRVLKSGIKDDLVEYLCLRGYWHETPAYYFGAGDPTYDNELTPENLAGLDLATWLRLQEQQN